MRMPIAVVRAGVNRGGRKGRHLRSFIWLRGWATSRRLTVVRSSDFWIAPAAARTPPSAFCVRSTLWRCPSHTRVKLPGRFGAAFIRSRLVEIAAVSAYFLREIRKQRDFQGRVDREGRHRRRGGAVVEFQIEYDSARDEPPEADSQFMVEVRQRSELDLFYAESIQLDRVALVRSENGGEPVEDDFYVRVASRRFVEMYRLQLQRTILRPVWQYRLSLRSLSSPTRREICHP